MLTIEEKSIVERDPLIKGLAILLDEDAVLKELQKVLLTAKLTGAKKKYIRYKPGTECLVLYDLETKSGLHCVYIKAYGADNDIKFQKSSIRKAIVSGLGIGRALLPEFNIEICSFPNDNKLKRLIKLNDSGYLSKIVKHTLGNSGQSTTSLRTLVYKPERRYVGKLNIDNGTKATVKIYSKRHYPSALEKAKAQQKDAAGFLPELIGGNQENGLIFFNWIPGKDLKEKYTRGSVSPEWLKIIGRKLATYHKNKEHCNLQKRNTDSFIKMLYELSSELAQTLPAVSELANALVRTMEVHLQSLRSVEKTRIHGDFSSQQILISGDKIHFIDLDDNCIWYPAYDVGVFIARLKRDVLQQVLTEEKAVEFATAFVCGYRSEAPCDQNEIELFVAIGLFQLARQPFRHCEPDWPGRLQHLLQMSQQHLEKLKHIPESSSTEPHTTVEIVDPKITFLTDLFDTNRMSREILQALPKTYTDACNARVSNVELLRHRIGKRCLLEYTLMPSTEVGEVLNVVGKVRARSLDRRTWELNKQLYVSGFNRTSLDNIQIPEPFGIIPKYNMWIQRKVPGDNPFDKMVGSDAIATAKIIAGALFKLHSSSIQLDREHTIAEELGILEDNLSSIIVRMPNWENRIQKIILRAQTLARSLPPYTHACIHRDFYHDQLLIDGQIVYLLDLDLCSIGDPALDVGNFIAHIQEQCLRLYNNFDYCNRPLVAFIERYNQLVGKDLSKSVMIYAALTMARHIFISQRIENRKLHTKSIIRLTENLLLHAEKTLVT